MRRLLCRLSWRSAGGLPLRLPHDGAFFVGNFDQELNKNYTELFQDKALGFLCFFFRSCQTRCKTWLILDRLLCPKFFGMDRGLITTPIMVLSKGPATPTSRSDRDSTRLWTFAMEICSGCVLLTKFTV